jgi:hypothetical protein
MMPADSRFGTVRTARSCNAAPINSAIAAAMNAQDSIVQEMMLAPLLIGHVFFPVDRRAGHILRNHLLLNLF